MSLLGAYGLVFEKAGKRLIDEVSVELEAGQFVALLGPNGAGKTTFLKLLAGIAQGNESESPGLVQWNKQDIQSFAPAQRARQIAYVPPEIRAEFPMTAYEAVALGTICHDRTLYKDQESDRRIQIAMERCLCWKWRDQDLHDLSGGERQLVALARALVQGARILLLDEALSKMDLHHQAQIGQLLKTLTQEEQYLVIVVSHDVNLASQWAEEALILKSGKKIAFGKLDSVMNEKSFAQLYPGAKLLFSRHPGTGKPQVYFSSTE